MLYMFWPLFAFGSQIARFTAQIGLVNEDEDDDIVEFDMSLKFNLIYNQFEFYHKKPQSELNPLSVKE